MRMRWLGVAGVLVLASCSSSDSSESAETTTTEASTPASDADTPLRFELTGGNQAPHEGDPDGTGGASIRFDGELSQVCIELSVQQVDDVIAVHLQRGLPGQSGPIVLPLPEPDASGQADGCRPVNEEQFTAIRDQPQEFYVNVRTEDFPDGSIRGQLAPME